MNHDARSADALLIANADLSRQIGELNTTIGYQDAMLAQLRGASIDLLNQLALLIRDDETYLWKIGGRPLDAAYKALQMAIEETDKDE